MKNALRSRVDFSARGSSLPYDGRTCFFLALLTFVAPCLSAQVCPPIPQETIKRVEQYLGQRLTAATPTVPTVQSVSVVLNTCYHQLSITMPGRVPPVVMYLSPDGRFLTSTLYDLAEDPAKEVLRIATDVGSLLMRDPSPRLETPDSRVVLVEFGDLQCPYCRQFSDWYKAVPADLRRRTKLVFKHLPLDIHSWARAAATLGACTAQQSPTAFWVLADYLLTHQPELQRDNVKDRSMELLAQRRDIDVHQLNVCVSGDAGSAVVARDEAVAKQLAVHSTPTLFVNGRRVLQLHSQKELEDLLKREIETPTMSLNNVKQK